MYANMCVCMYVCKYVYIYACMYVYILEHVYASVNHVYIFPFSPFFHACIHPDTYKCIVHLFTHLCIQVPTHA